MKRLLHILLMIAVAVSFAACDKDSPDNPDNPNGGTDNPGASVSDPAGTVTLKMRNADNGKTYLDDILIIIGKTKSTFFQNEKYKFSDFSC